MASGGGVARIQPTLIIRARLGDLCGQIRGDGLARGLQARECNYLV